MAVIARAAFGAVLLVFAPVLVRAQTVAGRVVDSATRRPLAHVAVRLVPGSDSVRDTVFAAGETVEDGAFLLVAPRPGTYRVRIGAQHLGPPLVLATAEAEDAHLYPVGPEPADDAPVGWHVLRGAALAAVIREHRPLLACEVEQPAGVIEGTLQLLPKPPGVPAHPGSARVLLQFVVDASGRVEANTVRTWSTSASDPFFVDWARSAVSRARFVPAATGGWKLRQWVKIPLDFTLAGESPPPPLPRRDLSSCTLLDAPPAGMIEVGAHS